MMTRSLESPKSVNISAEIQTVIWVALFATILLSHFGTLIRQYQLNIDDFPAVGDSIGPSTVKIFKASPQDGDDLLPLCTGFIVKSDRQLQDREVFVATRLSLVDKHELEVCYYPYSREESALGPSNLAPVEVIFRDEVRDWIAGANFE